MNFWQRLRLKTSPPRSDTAPMGTIPRGRVIVDGRTYRVSTYALDLRPVTNAEYAAFVRAMGLKSPPWMHQMGFNSLEQPVVGITYTEASAYAAWANKRLPSLQEWMRAARGDAEWSFPWGESAPDVGRCDYAGKTRGAPAEVEPLGRPLGRGPFGHHDLLGCVWEWCDGGQLCGGFFGAAEPRLEVTLREPASRRSAGFGFRCAR